MLDQNKINQLLEAVRDGTYGYEQALRDIAAAQLGEDVRAAMYAAVYIIFNFGSNLEDNVLHLTDSMIEKAIQARAAATKSACGTLLAISDSNLLPPDSLIVYGKSLRYDTPNSNVPAAIRNAGSTTGEITVNLADANAEESQQCIGLIPNGLPGLKVPSGGTFIDDAGVNWIADEADFVRKTHLHRVAEVVLDGSEAWGYNSSIGMFMLKTLPNVLAKPFDKQSALCSHYPYGAYANAEMPDKHFKLHFISTSNEKILYVKDSDFSTAAGFKAHLAAKPMTLLYVLDEPVMESLTVSSDIEDLYPVTVVTNDAGAPMKVSYTPEAADGSSVPPVQSAGHQRMLDRIDNAMLPELAKAQMPAAPAKVIDPGQLLSGINYSSCFAFGRMVGSHVLLSTYYSALENPVSKMYTEGTYGESALSSYYGINCSGFLSYVLGRPFFTTTHEFAYLFTHRQQYEVLSIATVDDLHKVKRGDVLINTIQSTGNGDHVRIVKDVVYDATGRLAGFNISESWKPYVKTSFFSPDEFLAQFAEAQPYDLVRIPDDEISLQTEDISYSRTVYPDKGDKSIYSLGETIMLYMPDHERISTITYSRVDAQSASVTVDLDNLVPMELNGVIAYCLELTEAGDYRIHAGEASDDPCYVSVVDPGELGRIDTATFTAAGVSDNLTPVYVQTIRLLENDSPSASSYEAPEGYSGTAVGLSQKEVDSFVLDNILPAEVSTYIGYYVRLWMKNRYGNYTYIDSEYIFN